LRAKLVVTAGVILALVVVPSTSNAILGVSIKLGGGFIPDGSVPGAVLQAEVGPLCPFVEFFRKSGVTTVNTGAHLMALRLPAPLVSPYAGIGGGLSRVSSSGTSKTRVMINAVVGTDLKLPGTMSFFGQAKYMYTLGADTGSLGIREVAVQAGLRLYLGL
jgi:hypothetical protein